MHRRKYIGLTGVALGVGLAGCASGGSDGGASGTIGEGSTPKSTKTPTESPTPTASPTPSPTPVPGPGDYDAKTVRESATDVAYDTLFRKIEQYEKESVHFEYGLVYQTIYEDGYTYLQLDVTNDSNEWEGDVAATYWGDDRLLENDFIELWAVVEGLHEYETVKGDTRTIPLLTIVDYELREQ